MMCNTSTHFERSHEHPHRIFTPARVGSSRDRPLAETLSPRDSSARSSAPGPQEASSLLLALVARTTASGDQAALVDGADAFDPASAVAAGADLSRLLWVKCGGRLRRGIQRGGSPRPLPWLRARGARSRRAAADSPGTHPAGALPSVARSPPSRAIPPSCFASPIAWRGAPPRWLVSVRRVESHWIGRPHPTRLAGLTSEALVLRSRAHLTRIAILCGEQAATGVNIEWQL